MANALCGLKSRCTSLEIADPAKQPNEISVPPEQLGELVGLPVDEFFARLCEHERALFTPEGETN